MTVFRSCSFLFLAITLLVLHANARELAQPKNTINNQNKEGVQVISSHENKPTNTNNANNNKVINPTKDLPNKGDEVNVDDEKNFISFAGVGAAGGIGGVAGVMPIGFIDKGLIPGGLPAFGGLGGGGLGGAGGAGGLGGAGGAGGLGGAGGTGGLGGLGGGGVGGGGFGGLAGGGLGGSSRSVTPP